MNSVVSLSNICFSYNVEEDILKDISLDIKQGEVVSIIGNSGCGKSTLMNLIAGLLTPSQGIVQRTTDSISYLMQKPTLLSHLNVSENSLLAYQLLNNKTDDDVLDAACNLLNKFKLSAKDFLKFPNELSGGMKQRVALVQSLITEVDLYLYDEPFSAIDISTLEIIKEYIWRYFNNSNKTLVFITHNIDQALQLSNKVVVMRNDGSLKIMKFNTEFSETPPMYRNVTDIYNKYFISIIESMR